MIRIPALITNEYPELAVLYEHDVKFSDILPNVQFEFGKTLAVMGEMVWKRFASELGLTAEDIQYATTLKAHDGSAVLNMFDTYMRRYKNSLLDVVHALSKLQNKRALTKIKELWPAILDSQQRVTQRVASPDQHQMTLSSIDSGHNEEHIVMEDGMGETLVPSCDSSMMTHIPRTAALHTQAKQYQHPAAINQRLHQRQPCQSPAYHQSPNTNYEWTRAWVESNGFLKNNNGSIPFVKEEKPAVSLNCSVSNDTAHIELQSVCNSAAEFSNKQQIEANNAKSFCSTVPQDPVRANEFVKADNSKPKNGLSRPPDAVGFPSTTSRNMSSDHCRFRPSTRSMSDGKLPSFSTSFHKGSSQIEDGSFNPLAPVPNGDCSVILNNKTHLLDNRQAACEAEQMDISSLDRSSSQMAAPRLLYHTLPLSKSEAKKLDSVIYRKSCSLHPVGPALDALRRSPSCTGKVESCPYADSMRNSSIFITHLYRGLSPTQTKSESFNNKCAISLGTCLKDNRFRIQMDVPKRNRVPGDEDWRNWLDRKFSTANFIIVCVTPEYLEVVNSLEIEDHDELMDNIQSTRYIYHLMQHEFEENYGVNSRFIPVLFKDLQNYPVGFLPNFLQTEGMGPYVWSRDYLDLLWRLDRHEVRLGNINGMT